MSEGTTSTGRAAEIVRWLGRAIIVLSLLLLASRLPLGEMLAQTQSWIDSLGFWGPLVYVLIYIVAVVLMLPGSVVTLAAGAFFGLWMGVIVASIGSTVGAALAFLIARYLARSQVEAALARNKRLTAVDRAITQGGWKMVVLLRLSPAIPFNLQNYLYGITGLSFWRVILASWVAMLPGTFLFVYLGATARAGLEAATQGGGDRTWGEWIFLGIGLVATLVVTIYVSALARRALREARELPQEPDNESSSPEPVRGFTPGTILMSVIAVALLAGAIYTQLSPTTN